MYIVKKTFKCRYQNFKVFKVDDEYKSVDKKHTEKLIKEGYIKCVEKQPSKDKDEVVVKKKVDEKPKKSAAKKKETKEKTDKK